MSEDIKSYIDNLFSYIDTYERRGAEFKTEAFLQTYNGVYTVFQALRQQRDKAIDVDNFFLQKIQQLPITGSDLRQMTIQILVTYFESEADTDGQTNKAYMYCRGQRETKQDVPFFENQLVPVLFKDGALHNNFRLNRFFLKEIARYINKFGKPLQANITPEAFGALGDPMKLLELARRRFQLGKDLLSDRNSLEYDLQRLNIYNKLADSNKLFHAYFAEWKYREIGSFWEKLKNTMAELSGKLKGAFSSFGYFRLVIKQRNPAYLYYSIIIILFILLAIYVPSKWNSYAGQKYEQMQGRASELQGTIKK
jgi:hypothetical protein